MTLIWNINPFRACNIIPWCTDSRGVHRGFKIGKVVDLCTSLVDSHKSQCPKTVCGHIIIAERGVQSHQSLESTSVNILVELEDSNNSFNRCGSSSSFYGTKANLIHMSSWEKSLHQIKPSFSSPWKCMWLRQQFNPPNKYHCNIYRASIFTTYTTNFGRIPFCGGYWRPGSLCTHRVVSGSPCCHGVAVLWFTHIIRFCTSCVVYMVTQTTSDTCSGASVASWTDKKKQ